MKRTSASVDLDLYAALFKDMVAWDPGLRKSLDRDLLRLRNTPEDQIEILLMIDLVKAGKVVDKALSSGYLNVRNLPSSMGRVRDGYRSLFSGLFIQVFDRWGRLRDGTDCCLVAFLRQVLYMAKKVRKECSDASILEEVNSFAAIDASLIQPSLRWDASTGFIPGSGVIPRMSFADKYRSHPDLVSERDVCPKPLLLVLDRVCGILLSGFPVLDWREVRPKHGPGAVADAKSGSDKYRFPTWPGKLEGMFPSNYFARSREDLANDDVVLRDEEVPSRLLAVPKTLSGPRLIASEPTSHQFIQLGLMSWVREKLPRILGNSISFLDQSPSRELCKEASYSGKLATVDLSSASDRLSCWVVERVFQHCPSLLEALWASRTRTLRNCVKNSRGQLIGEDYHILLKKFAPMGSGVTFPIQSIVYAAVSIAVVLYEDRILKPKYRDVLEASRKVRVFGDDIILPSYAVPELAHLFAYLQLKVNVGKTHWEGHFRESCGMDAYYGDDVTPVYLRAFEPGESGQSISSWVDVSNNAHSAGYWYLADEMTRKLGHKSDHIPVTRDNLACLTLSTFCLGMSAKKMRYSRTLHRPEVLGLTLEVKTERRRRESHQSLLQYFLEDPSPLVNWAAGWTVRQRSLLRKRWVSSF